MSKPVTAHKRRLEEEEADTVREDYVKKMRDNYPLIIRTLMHDIIVSIDKDGVFVFLNDAAVEFWGKPSEEIIGTHFSDFLYPEDVERAYKLGCNSFIVKPAAFEDFIEAVMEIKRYWLTLSKIP